MSHATRRRNHHGTSQQPIKEELEGSASLTTQRGSRVSPVFAEQNTSTYSNSSTSNGGNGSAYLQVDQSFYHGDRSDAPPPSDVLTEPEPLLRETRIRPNPMPESPVNVEESFLQTSFQDIGKRLKACNDTLGELQQLGVSHSVPLPELVLVGDQSSGKSSLMSGLANLDLPRSEGACTRCPLHIHVSRNQDWSCRVSLVKEYSYRPPGDRAITEGDVTDRDPFFPWHKKSRSTTHEFKTMHDKNEIENVLRWAQIAILNDNQPHELFIPGSGRIALNRSVDEAAEETVAKFSPNIVALEIKGPGLPNISFFDMPGIFQNPGDISDSYLVNVVLNLSREYMSHKSAIILCATPMNSDAENSCTFGLIRSLGASDRTVGVLTKADLLPDNGNRTQWLNIMKGKTHRTGHGYFITSRRPEQGLEELQQWEKCMFEDHTVEGWPPAFHDFVSRCGIEKLKDFLSERLGEEFIKSLPQIKLQVKANLEKNSKVLDNLPELPDNVEYQIGTSLMRFGASAQSRLDTFVKHFNTLPVNFRECLLGIKPMFILKDWSDGKVVVELSDDESDAGSSTHQNGGPSKRRRMAPPATPSRRGRETLTNDHGSFNSQIKGEDDRDSAPPTPSPRPSPVKGRQFLPRPFSKFSDVGRSFRTLRKVREEIEQKTKAGMPDRIPDEVYEDLAMEAIRPWQGPMKAFLNETMSLLQHELDEALTQTFSGLQKRLVYKESRAHVRALLEEHRKAIDADLQLLYKDQTTRLLTFNDQSFKKYKEDELIILTRFRHFQRVKAAWAVSGSASGVSEPTQFMQWEALTEDKRAKDVKTREIEIQKIGPDQFDREVEVVAYVRGYYRLAALRFADSVSQYIICRLIPGIQRELVSDYLRSKLGLNASDPAATFARLMAEDDATANRRTAAKAEKEKFARALASIEMLENGTQDGGFSQNDPQMVDDAIDEEMVM